MDDKKVLLKLRWVICQLACDLGMSAGKTSESIKNDSKEKLIDYFCELKELYLKQENSRLIDMLLSVDVCEQDLEFDE